MRKDYNNRNKTMKSFSNRTTKLTKLKSKIFRKVVKYDTNKLKILKD